MRVFGIKHHLTTAYHPQVNGLDEWFNQTLINSLAKFVQDDCDTWDQHLQEVVSCTTVWRNSFLQSWHKLRILADTTGWGITATNQVHYPSRALLFQELPFGISSAPELSLLSVNHSGIVEFKENSFISITLAVGHRNNKLKEALAVTWVCGKFYYYILGRPFMIEADPKPLLQYWAQSTLTAYLPEYFAFISGLLGSVILSPMYPANCCTLHTHSRKLLSQHRIWK